MISTNFKYDTYEGKECSRERSRYPPQISATVGANFQEWIIQSRFSTKKEFEEWFPKWKFWNGIQYLLSTNQNGLPLLLLNVVFNQTLNVLALREFPLPRCRLLNIIYKLHYALLLCVLFGFDACYYHWPLWPHLWQWCLIVDPNFQNQTKTFLTHRKMAATKKYFLDVPCAQPRIEYTHIKAGIFSRKEFLRQNCYFQKVVK
jgi:hypothetical protein